MKRPVHAARVRTTGGDVYVLSDQALSGLKPMVVPYYLHGPEPAGYLMVGAAPRVRFGRLRRFLFLLRKRLRP